MGQDIFSTTLEAAIRQLGPGEESRDEKGRLNAVWSCGCEFHATDRNGGGILFACEEHADKDENVISEWDYSKSANSEATR